MRLEVILSGEFHSVAAFKLTKELASKFREVFGDEWRDVLNKAAVGPDRGPTQAEVRRMLRTFPDMEYQREGVLLSSPTLALAITLDDLERFAEQLDQTMGQIRPQAIMESYTTKDVLGVFTRTGGGFLRCVFHDVSDFNGADLSLICDDLQKLLNRKEPFELVHSMTFLGREPDETVCAPASRTKHLKHVYHVKR